MLTPALLQPLLAGLSRTLTSGGAQHPEAAAALLNAFHPADPLQAMLAAQAVALHHAAMDCFARATEAGPEDHGTAAKLHRNAASLTRAFTATLRTLQRCQAEASREDHMQREKEPAQKEFSPSPCQTRAGAGMEAPPNADPSTPPPSFGPLRDPNPQRKGELIQRPSASPEDPVQEDPMQRENRGQPRWEDLTEAEQFALLYPERAAAGATSHEDADLWLPKFTSQPTPAAR